jgi:hypothetical protein
MELSDGQGQRLFFDKWDQYQMFERWGRNRGNRIECRQATE